MKPIRLETVRYYNEQEYVSMVVQIILVFLVPAAVLFVLIR